MTPSAPTSDIVRCSSCGHLVDTPLPPRCTLCDAALGSTPEEGADVSPFAECYARNTPARGMMNNWVWFAGRHRLKHLALMRVSAASRLFARGNLFILATCLAVFEMTQVGWRAESPKPVAAQEYEAARHKTWILLAGDVAAEGESTEAPDGTTAKVRLWWSPVQSGFAAVNAFVVGVLACLLAHWIIGMGTSVALGRAATDRPPMTATLDYGTAWIVPLVVATAVVSLRPIAMVGEVCRWSWHPSRYGLELAAAVATVFTAVMWWFWLIRVGTTTVPKVRTRVVCLFAAGVPMIAGLAGFGWYVAVHTLNRIMFRFMGVTF